jgi:L-aminopeptidase/D-esterase-like protein
MPVSETKNQSITAVEGLRVGHAERRGAMTGCTVVLLSPPAEVACEARGGWPGTYDTDSIGVGKNFLSKHAIFLTGGDVFGFDCAVGIRKFLLERGEAQLKGSGTLPGVVGANIYDLEFARIEGVRYDELGYEACAAASSAPVREGNYGAGIGATVGKFRGFSWGCKGGCGSAAWSLADGLVVGAIVVTNALGNVVDPVTNRTIAGARGKHGRFVEFEDHLDEFLLSSRSGNTTIGVVATNARLSHEQLIRMAQVAHDGLAISIRPVHTMHDGDTIFATSTGRWNRAGRTDAMVDVVGYLVTKLVAEAVVRGVKSARSLGGVPSGTARA